MCLIATFTFFLPFLALFQVCNTLIVNWCSIKYFLFRLSINTSCKIILQMCVRRCIYPTPFEIVQCSPIIFFFQPVGSEKNLWEITKIWNPDANVYGIHILVFQKLPCNVEFFIKCQTSFVFFVIQPQISCSFKIQKTVT